MIAAIAEKWSGMSCDKEYVELEKRAEGVFVNGEKVEEMIFNHIQLRFVMTNEVIFLLFDGRTESDLSIEEMHSELS
jgi:hypothetical protein